MFKPISNDKIEALDEASCRAFRNMKPNLTDNLLGCVVEQVSDKRRRQEVWLSVFEVTLSPKLAAKRAGVARRTHRRWLRSDPTFCRNYNLVLDRALGELAGIAMGQAMGYNTGETDADGKTIRTEGSDTLLTRFLDLDAPPDRDRVVSVDFSKRRRRSVVVVGTTDGTSEGPSGSGAAS